MKKNLIMLVCGLACVLIQYTPMETNAATFIIRQNTTLVIQIDDAGNCTFANGYAEESGNAPTAGNLRLKNTSGTNMLWSTSGNRINLTGRFTNNAFISSTGFTLRNPSQQVTALTASNGDFLLKGAITNSMTDPSLNGSYTFTSVVYGSSGAQYIPQYKTPTANYTTPRRNISAFFNSINPTWGFDASSVPINGMLRVPDGTGPFPLVLFVHGNHSAFAYSEPGYIYLCELLASQGIIAGTIDANFLNGNSGENDARAIMHLEHVKQFKTWNQQSNHPLYGKVDISKIMIVGHSRGGEAAGHASYFNTLSSIQPDPGSAVVPLDGSQGLGPYGFSFKCIFAIAPCDQQYTPVTGPTIVKDNYFVVQGGKDGDVSEFVGYNTFVRAHPIDLAHPTLYAAGFKSLLYIYGANHNFFNSTWPGEGSPSITRAEQEKIAKIYVGSLAKALLLNDSRYLAVEKCHLNASAWLPTTTTYESAFQDRMRFFFNHYEEDGVISTISPPTIGTNTYSNLISVTEPVQQIPTWGVYNTNNVVQLNWNSTSGKYVTTFQNALATAPFQYLVMHMNQTTDPLNTVNQPQDVSVIVKDNASTTAKVAVSSIVPLPYANANQLSGTQVVLQTVRIPLRKFADLGLNPSSIKEVTIATDIKSKGSVQIDEMQLSY